MNPFHTGPIRIGDHVGGFGAFVWGLKLGYIECRSYAGCSDNRKPIVQLLREHEVRQIWRDENIGGPVIIPALREAVGA